MGDYSKPTYANVVAQVVSYNGKVFNNQFIDNDGEYASLNKLYLEQIKDTIYAPTREGYTFAGYTSKTDGTVLKIDEDGCIETNDIVDGATYEAIWSDKEAPVLNNVSFTDNLSDKQIVTIEGSDTGSGVAAYYVGQDKPTKDTVFFEDKTEWTVDSDGIWYIAIKDKKGNIAYSKYTFYYVTFNGNKGLSANEPVVTCDKKLICNGTIGTLPEATKKGYEFLGWVSNQYNVNESVEPVTDHEDIKSNVILYAAWNLNYKIEEQESVIYDGNAHTRKIITEDDSIKITYIIDDKSSNKPIEWVNAGTYEVKYQISYPGDVNIASGSFEYMIEKAPAIATVTPTGLFSSYTGNDIELVTPGQTNDGTIYYKIGENGTYSPTIPTAALNNSYEIYWYIKGDRNHTDSEEEVVNANISTVAFKNVSATGYTGAADTKMHYGTVKTDTTGVTIEYSSDNKTWQTSNIGSSSCGKKTVYYRIRKEGFSTVSGKFVITINHNYTSKSTTETYLKSEATCTKKAVYYHKCCNCSSKGTTTFESGSALGHDYSSKTVNSTYLKSKATCTAAAVYYHKCSRCTAKGTTYYSYGKALGHSCSDHTTGHGTYSGSCGYSRCDRCGANCGGAWDTRINSTGDYSTSGAGWSGTSTVSSSYTTVKSVYFVDRQGKKYELKNGTTSVYDSNGSSSWQQDMKVSGIGTKSVTIKHTQIGKYCVASLKIYFADGKCVTINIT